MNLRGLGLIPKIAIGFGSLIAIIAAMGLVGYRTAAISDKTAHEMESYSSMMDMTSSMQQALLTQRVGSRDILMGMGNESLHLYEQGETDFGKALADLQPLLTTDEDREHFARSAAARVNYASRNDEVMARYRAGDRAGATEMFKDPASKVASDALADAMHIMTVAFWQQRQVALNRQMTADRRSKTLMLVLALAGLALGLTIAFLIAISIVRANRKIITMIHAISCNNLMADDMEVLGNTEMGKAAQELNKMKNGLRRMILSIASTAENVSNSSREIFATAAQAANSADNQKQQVEQIATAMHEMTATVREVSHHSNTAARSAKSAAESAREGGRIVEDVLQRMRGIAQSAGESAAKIEQLGARSDEIGRIVGVIGEIAEQTNLLALNAAIEAARAGEQGRGFAVVAGEVRRLAERTAGATKEISVVIQNVQSMTADAVRHMRSGSAAVEQGAEITGFARESIEKIVREADSLGSMVAQIACSATQQAAATEQVTAGMSQISKLAIESAEGSQLSAHACEELFDLSLGLRNMVARFDVGRCEKEDAEPPAAIQRGDVEMPQRPWEGSGVVAEVRSTSKRVGAGVSQLPSDV
jgi:methyl-accepting chemotaxis protein